jgi:hypothetical protein
MRRIALLGIIAGFLIPLLASAPASAQATRTWVSGVGDDVNPCSRTAPCKTFAGAISKTAVNGEINCIDPGGFGAVTITKSITIDCSETSASILSGAGVSGIVINITSATDVLKTVRIRGITINGSANGTRGGNRGINILAALAVHINGVFVDNFTQQGIVDVRTTGGKLYVGDTTSRNNAGSGISVAGSLATLNATIDNSRFEGNGVGIAAAAGNNVMVKRSVMAGNGSNGVQADGGSQVTIEGSTINANPTGINVTNATAVVRIANNDIMFNTATAISGATTSFGFNRIAGNAAAGTAPTPAGGASNGLGTQ